MRRTLLICATPVEFGVDTPACIGLGGIESTNLALARALVQRSFAVTLATRRSGIAERDGVLNIPLTEIGHHDADTVVSSNDPRPLLGYPDRQRIVWVHNPINLEKAVRKRYLWPIVAMRPRAVFVGSLAAETMSPLFPYRRRHVVPHGIGAEFRLPPPTRGLSRDFVYASQPQRGLERLLGIWRHSAAVIASGARLHVFGSGSQAGSEGDDRIVFHPRLGAGALATFYTGARAMVCPGSPDETFCLAAAEAQAMGLPVITAGIGALSERVQHGINGLIAGTDREFAEAIVELAGNEALWQHLSAGALLQRTALTWERSAVLWETILRASANPGASATM